MHCPVCGSARSSRLYQAADPHHGIPGLWWIRECGQCNSMFLENPPTPQELASLYPEESYYSYRLREPTRLKRLLHALVGYEDSTGEPRFERPGSVLDFGCGAGEFLLGMRALGWDCAGVEISAAARDVARQHGLDVRDQLTGATGFDDRQFDYIRANHSLEHVPDPRATLREMMSLLKPGGTLFLGIPTRSGVNSRIFGPNWFLLTPPLHTFVPSTHAARSLLEGCGLDIVRARTNTNWASTGGSLQIWLNRARPGPRSSSGILFTLKPLLLATHWLARLEDLAGAGDRLELIAVKPAA